MIESIAKAEPGSRSVAIAILDENGIIKYVSPFISELLGYDAGDLEGREGLMLLYHTSLQRARALYKELQRHVTLLIEGLLQFRKKDGAKAGLYVHASNLLDHPGINGIMVHLRHFVPAPVENNAYTLPEEQVKINIETREKVWKEIAAELHDHINPTLVAIRFLIYSIKDAGEHLVVLEEISQILTGLIVSIREISRTAAAFSSADFRLGEALETILGNFKRNKSLRLVLRYDQKLEELLTHKQKTHILRILQEQMTNITRHAKASKALISIRPEEQRVVVTTSDNGVGFEPSEKHRGVGLSNMLYRVNDIGGNMHIRSRIGFGTMIQIQFPLAPPHEH